MRYKLLGRTGLRVSEVALGTMTFGQDWGWGADLEESRRVLDRFVDAGGNFVDTANNYTQGTSEQFDGAPTEEGSPSSARRAPCPGTGRLVAVIRSVPEASHPRDGDDVAFGRGRGRG